MRAALSTRPTASATEISAVVAAGPVLPASRPFNDLPNVLMTPNVSGWTEGMLDARAKLIAENIRRVAHRETPLNLVAP
jgi:phosphoglycerate dehydrogenase-like enzyme